MCRSAWRPTIRGSRKEITSRVALSESLLTPPAKHGLADGEGFELGETSFSLSSIGTM
jgi:hypothetical protein